MTDLFSQGAADLAEDAKRLLGELDLQVPGATSATADCRPLLDVVETAHSLDIIVDLPGVAATSLRVVVRRSTLLVVGVKLPVPVDQRAKFHLAERSYGRFARAVRLTGALDAARARAVTRAGQLRISLPLIEDRRGRLMTIPVEHE